VCVEVDGEVKKPRECDLRVAQGKGLHGILNLARVPRANFGGIHDGFEAAADPSDIRFAHREEMWPEATDRLLENDLEERAGDERVSQAEDARGGISEAAAAVCIWQRRIAAMGRRAHMTPAAREEKIGFTNG
jgi:hypothetical protein